MSGKTAVEVAASLRKMVDDIQREREKELLVKTTFVAVCWGYWGRGPTAAAAIRRMRQAGAEKSAAAVIHRNDRPDNTEKPYVDARGSVIYAGDLFEVGQLVGGVYTETVSE